jgi:hypothetical protein
VTLAADLVRQYASWTQMLVGVESDPIFSHLVLRGGVNLRTAGESRTAYSFGASLRAFDQRLVVHYGATMDDETAFGTTQRLSLAVGI